MDGEKSARAFGDTGAEGHVEVAEPPAMAVEGRLLLTLLIQEPVKLVLLQGDRDTMKASPSTDC